MQKLKTFVRASILPAALVLFWQSASTFGLVPVYMLPSPIAVISAFISDFPALMDASVISLTEAFLGLFYAVAAGVLFAVLMDSMPFLYSSLYPILTLTQTIPSVAIAPLLVLWMGYGMAPKIMLVFLVCFFPITVGVLDGLRAADSDTITLLKTMGASKRQIIWHIKIPSALTSFFSGLKIAVTYAIVGAVIAEWLGGNAGLGVYMTRARKSYSFDRMFAVIALVSALSIFMLWLVKLCERRALPYRFIKNEKG